MKLVKCGLNTTPLQNVACFLPTPPPPPKKEIVLVPIKATALIKGLHIRTFLVELFLQ